MPKYNHIAIGGTFDHFHIGHQNLIKTTFQLGKKVSIGITTEEFTQKKSFPLAIESYHSRLDQVKDHLKKKNWLKKTNLIPLFNIYGPTLSDSSIEALVVTKNTFSNAEKINLKRQKIGLKPLVIKTIPLVCNPDGKTITSERIRKGEIDRQGFSYLNLFPKNSLLILPKNLRKDLRKPLGTVYPNTKSTLAAINKLQPFLTVSVGDVITKSLLESEFTPNIQIIDHKNKKRQITLKILTNEKSIQTVNKPGTINKQTALAFQTALNNYLNSNKPQQIIVDGEEDLTAIIAILLSPLQSLVVYGQIGLGVVIIKVTEQKKQEILRLVKKFSRGT